MLVNDELYFQTFCRLLETVVEAGGLEVPVERLQKSHFCFLSRKINQQSGIEYGIQPTTLRDYRYIYKQEKKFSIRQNRLDLMCEFLGYDGWNDFKQTNFKCLEKLQESKKKVRLLVLPDKRIGEVKKFEGQIAELIVSRYEELKDELEIENLEIVFEDKPCPVGTKEILDLAATRHADIVTWPEYLHGKHPLMRVQTRFVDAESQMAKVVRQQYQKVNALADLLEGAFLEQTDVMVFNLLGTTAFTNEEVDKARTYFEKVLALAPDHSDANNYMDWLKQAQTSHQKEVDGLASDFEISEKTTAIDNEANSDENNCTSPEFPNLPIAQDNASLDKHLLVLKGDNHVLKSKDLEPLVRSMLIHEDEPVIFLTSHTDMSLMSMNDLNVFHVQAVRKEVPLKEVLISSKQQIPVPKCNDEQRSVKWLLIHHPHPNDETDKGSTGTMEVRFLPGHSYQSNHLPSNIFRIST